MPKLRFSFLTQWVGVSSLVLGISMCAKSPGQTVAEAASQAPAPASAPTPTASVPPTSFAPLVDSVKSAVVNVSVKARVRAPRLPEGFDSDFFNRFFGMPGQDAPPQVRQGAGSGFIIDARGRMLTNNHVVDGADDIEVKLPDGRSFKARILGRDPLTDLALLELQNASNLPVVKLGNSDALRVGDWVLAIGNPFGLASSVSAGILSAKARDIRAGPYDDFLQTDAAINPGNSGGPLFNLQGEVVGINTAIIGGGSGIGFAVPSNMAKLLLPQLEKGAVKRGWLGVSIQDLSADLARGMKLSVKEGALVSQVNEGTPAAKAGLLADDVIVEVDGQPIDSAKALTRAIGFKLPQTTATLTVLRGKERKVLKVELGERPNIEGVDNGVEAQDEDTAPQRLGLSVQEMPDRKGNTVVVISQVAPGSPAEEAGLEPRMQILEAQGQKVKAASELKAVLKKTKSGDVVLFRVEVGGQRVLRALKVP